MWIKWFVLAACVVIAQSFPRPEENFESKVENLKERTQYYIRSDNGDFKYGYNTGNGAYESVVKMGSGDLIGYFGYVDPIGQNVRLDYTAGVGGFVPMSSLLPVAPQVDAAAFRSSVSGSATDTQRLTTDVAALSQPIEEPDFRSVKNLDETYSSQIEPTDSLPNIEGEEFFVADDGQNQQIRDSAGSGTGYVEKGDSISVVPEAPTDFSARSGFEASYKTHVASGRSIGETIIPREDASLTFRFQEPDSSREESAGTGYVEKGDSIPVVPDAPTDFSGRSVFAATYSTPVASGRSIKQTITPRGDASFTFRFPKTDSSREDSADSNPNVKGRYNFLVNDIIQRKSNYIAGPGTEFVTKGEYLPVATGVSASTQTGDSQATVYSGSASSSFSSRSGSSASSEMASDTSFLSKFKKQYNLDADDDVTGTVQNTAGSSTEFEDIGAQLPLSVPGISLKGTSVRTGNQLKFPADSSIGADQTSGSTSGSLGVPSFRRQDVLGESVYESNSGDDGSYSFSYTNPDNFRAESADSDLNVKGYYSFIADDGIERHIHYKAGSGIGFVAEGAHLPVQGLDATSGDTSKSASN